MNTLTLFNAYAKAMRLKEAMLSARGYNQGIAVNDDTFAKYWQRYERLRWKLEHRIEQALGAAPRLENPCWFCGYPSEQHRSTCPGRNG